MKLNLAERLLVNNPARAAVQRYYEAPLLRKLGGNVTGGVALEVGCGRGAGVELILRQFGAAHVYGIDLDSRQIERARKRLHSVHPERLTLVQGDAERLSFAGATFDAVFDFGALHHVPEWQKAIAEIRRVLKPGGTFFFEEVTRTALERWVYRKFLDHPAENRFSQSDFLEQVVLQGMKPAAPVKRTLFGDVFIGAAKREDQ